MPLRVHPFFYKRGQDYSQDSQAIQYTSTIAQAAAHIHELATRMLEITRRL
jgi:hypothetical protein